VAHFPSTPSFTGFNTPSRIEADIANLDVEGAIPGEIDGAFYRVQPDPQFPPRLGDDISFNGDGMITRFPDVHGAPFNPMEAASYLTRWTVDMASNSDAFDSVTHLTRTVGEFPRIDECYQGQPYRYGWMLEMDMARPVALKGGSAAGMLMNCLFLSDHETKAEQH
jgi:carotenoid cleavage dioxygenase-like enzyme